MLDVASNDHCGSPAIDLLAMAFLHLADEDDPHHKTNTFLDLPDVYLHEEWTKDANRLLRLWASQNDRPDRYPWRDARFDRLWPDGQRQTFP